MHDCGRGVQETPIEFATRNADNVLGWCTLAMVQDRCPTSEAWRAVGDAWAVLAGMARETTRITPAPLVQLPWRWCWRGLQLTARRTGRSGK